MKRKRFVCVCSAVLFLGSLFLACGQTYLAQNYQFPVSRTFHGGQWGEFFDLVQEFAQVFNVSAGTKLTIRLNLQIAPAGFSFATRFKFLDNGCQAYEGKVNGTCYPMAPGADSPTKEWTATKEWIAENGNRCKIGLYLYGRSSTEADYQITGNVAVTVSTPVQISGRTIPIANLQIITLQIVNAQQELQKTLCPTCTVRFPLQEISNALQGINEKVTVQLFKSGLRIIEIPTMAPKEMPAMKAISAAQFSNRNLLTEGSGYTLKIVGARGQTLAETMVSLKFQ